MAQRFFKIESRSILNPEWGDYGDILQNGMSMHRPRVNGRIALERTGPFIPPVTLSALAVLLTSDARASLESSGLSGFEIIPVEKVHIVELRWEKWDLQAEEPAEYPESGEPEDYILARPHEPTIANLLGDMWELASTSSVKIILSEVVNDFTDLGGGHEHMERCRCYSTSYFRIGGHSPRMRRTSLGIGRAGLSSLNLLLATAIVLKRYTSCNFQSNP